MKKLVGGFTLLLLGLGSSPLSAEPTIIGNEIIADSSNISVKAHALSGEGYLVDVVTPIVQINYGCAGETTDDAARELLRKVQTAIINGSLDMVGEFGCVERRRN